MPISEDEFSQYSNDSIPSTTMSKAELRKTHKPIMEKRRRAKINNCLNEIKQLILVALKKDGGGGEKETDGEFNSAQNLEQSSFFTPERHSKLEKADILEMAVKHLKNMQRQQREFAIRTDPSVALKYKAGFVECADEVDNYVSQLEGVDPALKQRLVAHLKKCATGMEHKPQFPFSNAFPSGSTLLAQFAQNRFPTISSTTDDQNNNARVQGIELIPSCLPNGDFAFLVPKSSFSSMLSSQLGEERQSAFMTVTPSSKISHGETLLKISKPLSPPMSPTSTADMAPRGFQPIIPKGEQKITSTTHKFPQEIQNIRFPIHTNKKENVSEPLCIITNNAERYRQAQMLEETYNNEENVYHGTKRRLREESHHGLLALAPHEPPRKLPKFDAEMPSSSKVKTERDGGEGSSKNDSMWRPW